VIVRDEVERVPEEQMTAVLAPKGAAAGAVTAGLVAQSE
jgi:hypothetical protein